MRINKINQGVGMFKNHIRKSSYIGYLDIIKGETSKSNITVYKEYINGKLDLKYIEVIDKVSKSVKSKLQHIRDGKIIWERIR